VREVTTLDQRSELDRFLPSILLIGTSYRHSPISFRETLVRALSGKDGKTLLTNLASAEETVLLSTCNRTELYAFSRDTEKTIHAFHSRLQEVLPNTDASRFFAMRGSAAIEHLFSVSSGLDSIILGEPQILSQVKGAGVSARREGSARGVLSPLFDRAYRVGHRIRTSHRLGSGEASLSSLAIRVAKQRLKRPRPRVLLIGSGNMIQIAAKELQKMNAQLYVASKRDSLPKSLGGPKIVGYEELARVASRCDLLISATTSARYLLKKNDIRGRRPKLIIDLGMPRNIDPAIRGTKNNELLDLDDLARTRPLRASSSKQLQKAESQISYEVGEFDRWLIETRFSSGLAKLYRWAHLVRDEEVQRALRKLRLPSRRERRVIDSLGRRVVSKLLSRPAHFVRNKNSSLSETERLRILQTVFDLGREGS